MNDSPWRISLSGEIELTPSHMFGHSCSDGDGRASSYFISWRCSGDTVIRLHSVSGNLNSEIARHDKSTYKWEWLRHLRAQKSISNKTQIYKECSIVEWQIQSSLHQSRRRRRLQSHRLRYKTKRNIICPTKKSLHTTHLQVCPEQLLPFVSVLQNGVAIAD